MPYLVRLQQVASVLSLSSSPSAHACRGVHRASTYSVLRRATQVLEYLAPAPLIYAAPFATSTGGLNSLPVEPTVYSCTCGDFHRAGISSVYAAQVQVLKYFAPAPVAYYALLRLQQVVSILSLSCPPYTLSRVVEYIAPAPAVLLHLRLSWCTSRWHKQCLTPRKHKCWSASRLRPQHMPDLLQLQQGVSFSPCLAHRLQLHLWLSTLRRHHNGMLHRACLNVHRANWDARAQFFDSVVIFPMSR